MSTEDGCVHECRTNFGEQMTRSFRGHLGAVYKVHESPFVAGLFLTASEDWTVKLWTHAKVCLAFESVKISSGCVGALVAMCLEGIAVTRHECRLWVTPFRTVRCNHACRFRRVAMWKA